MVLVETSFPRGGTAKAAPANEGKHYGERTKKEEKIIFGAISKEITKKKKRKPTEKDDKSTEVSTDLKAFSAECLSSKNVSEGMLIMGRVKSIDSTHLVVALPGRIVGRVPITYISNSYTKVLQTLVDDIEADDQNYKPLKEMFEINQIVCVKVMEIAEKQGKFKDFMLSLSPFDIHTELAHKSFVEGFIFTGAISELEDHGYIIETGVQHLRAFLPLAELEGKPGIGELVCCRVEKSTNAPLATTIVLKALVGTEKRRLKIKTDDLNDNYLIPSTVVKFKVTKILEDGLEGTIFNSAFTCYVNEHYLNTPTSSLKDYKIGLTALARILYVMPLTKFVYLSLNFSEIGQNPMSGTILESGLIVKDAKIVKNGTGGIILELHGAHRGLLSSKSLMKGKEDIDFSTGLQDFLLKKRIAVRILSYCAMDHVHICTNKPKLMKEKHFALDDVEVGEIVEGTVIRKLDNGDYIVTIGNIKGFINHRFLSSHAKILKIGHKIRVRVMAKDLVYNVLSLTNASEYLRETKQVLLDIEHAVVGKTYLGTIWAANKKSFTVKFFNNIIATMHNGNSLDYGSCYVGQAVYVCVNKIVKSHITVTLADQRNDEMGEIEKAQVVRSYPAGVEIFLKKKKMHGQIPVACLSWSLEMAQAHMAVLAEKSKLEVVDLTKSVYSVRDVQYFRENPVYNWQQIDVDTVLRAFVKTVKSDYVEVLLPIQGHRKLTKIHRKMLLLNTSTDLTKVLSVEQAIMVRVLGKHYPTKTLCVSGQLSQVWDGSLDNPMSLLREYFAVYDQIRAVFAEEPIGSVKIGEVVSGKITEINTDGTFRYEIKLKNGLKGVACGDSIERAVGDKVNAGVMWVDFAKGHLEVILDIEIVKGLQRQKVAENFEPLTKGLSGKLIYSRKDFSLFLPFMPNIPLIYIPRRVHLNDFDEILLQPKEVTKFTVTPLAKDNDRVLGLFKNDFSKMRGIVISVAAVKSKYDESQAKSNPEKSLVTSEDAEMDSPTDNASSIKRKQNGESVSVESEPKTKKNKKSKSEAEPQANSDASELLAKLPGVEDFWKLDRLGTHKPPAADAESSDEDDNVADETGESPAKKKKNLSSIDRHQLVKEEEARIRSIEETLANPNAEPQSADHYERLVLATPNNSLTWISYMAFHLQTNEVDKARGVAQRALKTITYREEGDLLNVWIALLNLELRFGTRETFDDVFREALQLTDQYKVHMRAVQVLADAEKVPELTDMISTITKKFKTRTEMWPQVGAAFFQVGLIEKGKQLMHKALQILPERDHVNTIVQFALLSNKHEQKENAHALLEQVLTSYPKRVDIWSTYVDMLVKDQKIDIARQILDRAISQKIPIKKMRTLFNKYVEFEQKFGDEKSVEKIKELAADYVEKEVGTVKA